MMTCRKCLHAPVCFDREGCTKYYGPEIAANNVEKLCIHFVDRSRYVVREKGEWVGWHGDRRVSDDEYGMPIYRHYHYFSCRKCGRRTAVRENFCPNCGADMRKGENG